jgi:hypothetical protein
MLLFGHIVTHRGVPLAVYHDRHGIFEPPAKGALTLAEQLAGGRQPTQFGRALQELAIESIAARSPQAKGRVERLWGTFQDRLVSELRLAGAKDLAEANRVLWDFLPRYNRRFAVPAAEAATAYRPLGKGLDLNTVFCFKYRCRVGGDNTLALGEQRLQLLSSPERASYAHARVEVQERLDGSLAVYYQGRRIGSKPAPPEAPLLRARDRERAGAGEQSRQVATGEATGREVAPTTTRPVPARRPSPNHPWNRPGKGVLAQRAIVKSS